VSRLAPSSGGAAAIHDRAFVLYDAKGVRVAEQKLEKRADCVARFGEEEWLLLAKKQKHLVRVNMGDPHTVNAREPPKVGPPFAAGRGSIDAFGVGRDDTVAIARSDTMELWSRNEERRWATKAAGPFTQAIVTRDHVVALGQEGALFFFSRENGEALGALRLASPDPVDEWRLVPVDKSIVILALGEWLVWIDAATRKTVRRVRARAKVVELAADGGHVAVAVEDGFVQAFRAATGEPRASFVVDYEDVCALALCPGGLFTMGSSGGVEAVRACDRQTLDVAARVASPICAVAARGSVVVAGDRVGCVRIMTASGPDLREISTITAGSEGTVGLHLIRSDTVVVGAPRVVMRVMCAPAGGAPRPIALRGPLTAFAADDAYVFAGTQTGAVEVYDLEAGRHITSYALSSDDRITALARLAGTLLVVGTGALDGRILFVDVADAKVVHRVSPHDEAFGVTCLASDARGRIVASGSDDGSVALLDPQKGRVLAKLRVNETPTSMAFEPSGRRLACVFADGTARLATFAAKCATWSDLGLRGVSHVAWSDVLFFGFKDGRVESGERHVRPSERPSAVRQ
jgi:outer membrane protein assembly factor BamB